MSVYPTFQNGPFSVTPITLSNLMLKSRRTNSIPIVHGPIFINHSKTTQIYRWFSTSLLCLNPKLKDLIALGTDGEVALSDAFLQIFPEMIHFRCSRHFEGNVIDALKARNVKSRDDQAFFRNKISGFESSGIYQMGRLLDCDSQEAFSCMLESLKGIFNEREPDITGKNPTFYTWLAERKEMMISCMIAGVRVKVPTLGNPPAKFYTNTSEAANHIIKSEMPEEHPVGPFTQGINTLIAAQKRDIELAIISQGDYYFAECFKHLQVKEDVWFSLDQMEKELYLKKLTTIPLIDLINMANPYNDKVTSTAPLPPQLFNNESLETDVDFEGEVQEENVMESSGPTYSNDDISANISVSAEDLFATVNPQGTSLAVLRHIWKNATLLLSKDAIVQKPSLQDRPSSSRSPDMEFYVASHSSNKCYVVGIYSPGRVSCNCKGYKATG